MFERFSRPARAAVVVAQEDARELRAPRIEVEHVLLGVLAQGDPQVRTLLAEAGLTHEGVLRTLGGDGKRKPLGEEDAEALRSIGIDLDAVRATLEAEFGADALDRALPEPQRPALLRRGGNWGHIPFSKESKKVLELSLREAISHKDKTIESAHLLLAVLRGPNEVTVRLFGGAQAIQDLRPKVRALLDRAA